MSFPYVTDVINHLFGTHWNLPLPTFGIIVAIAVVVAAAVATRMVREYERVGKLPLGSHTAITDMVLVATLAGIVGARVFDILDNFDRFVADPLAMILTRSGFSIYGGLCFGVLAGIAFVKRRSIPVVAMLDATAPALMLGYGIGRLGCQVAGDGDWGVPASLLLKPHWLPQWLWAQTYDGNIAGVIIASPGVYPTPLYEIAMALVIFWILWLLRSQQHRAGYLFSLYLLFAGFERLLIEKIRINTRYDVFGFHITQAEAISVLLVIAGLAGVLAALRTHRLWPKVLVSIGVLAALSACAPR
ncbi:MAG TPA: prolipoprotein diacylglyceryl transferase family protein [Steroidobacteraceae bacterium]|jgi:phosphatidylglycerol:prolipoprotein diacylglycerol transferase|nr:prolipoprotein diacylglyceryl transferase family protein [Steroidobacteraceae bacterium]